MFGRFCPPEWHQQCLCYRLAHVFSYSNEAEGMCIMGGCILKFLTVLYVTVLLGCLYWFPYAIWDSIIKAKCSHWVFKCYYCSVESVQIGVFPLECFEHSWFDENGLTKAKEIVLGIVTKDTLV